MRCPDCLGVSAIEAHLSDPREPLVACDGCGTTCDVMGEVRGARLVIQAEIVPCDERCSGATGPQCTCACGGRNHGLGMIAVVRDAGRIPRVTPSAPAKAAAIRDEWHAAKARARAAIEERYGDAIAAKRAGTYVSAPVFRRWLAARTLLTALHGASEMTSQRGRLARLEAIHDALAAD